MTITDMPHVTECTATSCAYNHDGCHAVAVNIDSDNGDCSTFFPTGIDGGLPTVMATVGACQRTDCVYNEHAVCGASEVHIGSGTNPAHCLTYTAS